MMTLIIYAFSFLSSFLYFLESPFFSPCSYFSNYLSCFASCHFISYILVSRHPLSQPLDVSRTYPLCYELLSSFDIWTDHPRCSYQSFHLSYLETRAFTVLQPVILSLWEWCNFSSTTPSFSFVVSLWPISKVYVTGFGPPYDLP